MFTITRFPSIIIYSCQLLFRGNLPGICFCTVTSGKFGAVLSLHCSGAQCKKQRKRERYAAQ